MVADKTLTHLGGRDASDEAQDLAETPTSGDQTSHAAARRASQPELKDDCDG